MLTAIPLSTFGSTADHSRFEPLEGPFADGPDITRACLSCHTEAAKQIQATKHWTWSFTNPLTGQILGKAHVVNNYCLSATPNIQSCALCHIGYGWTKPGTTLATYDFKREENVDCLVCHDTTATYSREDFFTPGKRKPDLASMAQQVGPTSRRTCGTCHFAGGGDKGVKHGDIDPTLEYPDVFIDVHMSPQGSGFTCSICHAGSAHDIRGSRYSPTGVVTGNVVVPGRSHGNRTACTDCHSEVPHRVILLNGHVRKLACETCHIPTYARGDYGTKMWWDWSEAGRRGTDGKLVEEKDGKGRDVYNAKKGRFIWAEDVVPEYRWFNGMIRYTLLGDVIDPTRVVPINAISGRSDDPKSRIGPFKVMRGRQPYDIEMRTLLAPLTATEQGYWKTFDWTKSIQLGMEAVNRPFSGHHGFVDTEMYWPINHMVAPKDDSLGCTDCHSPVSRLVNLPGIYMPGYSRSGLVEIVGLILIVVTGIAVLIHGTIRVATRSRHRRNGNTIRDDHSPTLPVFSHFERVWHWSQAALVIGMMWTGFNVHGSIHLLDFDTAVTVHQVLAWALLGVWGLAFFWHTVTNEWHQYLPSAAVHDTLHYYFSGIFKGAIHPFRVSLEKKHNPLQRITYLLILLVIMPLLWVSGLFYLFHGNIEVILGRWPDFLEIVAVSHTLFSYVMTAFVVGHLYMITTSQPWYSSIRAMITGRHIGH